MHWSKGKPGSAFRVRSRLARKVCVQHTHIVRRGRSVDMARVDAQHESRGARMAVRLVVCEV